MTNEIPIYCLQKNRFYLELMIVLSIVILLVALAIPIFLSAVQTARDQVDEANLHLRCHAQWLLADEANKPSWKHSGFGRNNGQYLEIDVSLTINV